MHEFDLTNLEAVLERIYAQAATENIRITQHAQQEMVEEDIPWMRSFKLLPGDTFWKIIPSTVEALVVCSTVLHKIVARFTLCVRQHDPCLLSSQFMNQNHRGG
jgi:hypothetical protein